MPSLHRPLARVASRACLVLLSWASLQAAPAPSTQASRRGAMISLKGSQGTLGAYLVKPSGKGPFPAVVVIQEWWGLNDQIKGVADRITAEGYVAVAPDLYHGKVATDPEKAHELMRGLDDKEAVADLGTAMDYLRSLPEVGKSRIGSVGFCMGGGLSLKLALSRPDLAGAVMFYGSPETDPAVLKTVACPVLGLFGEEDQGISREKVELMAKGLQEVGKGAEVKTYPKAGHAFFNETRPSYVPEAAADAWKRTVAFFQAKLKG